MEQDKTPQNINDLVSEIGERMILFKLYSTIYKKEYLEIFKNYSESGYDIGIRNTKNNSKVKIEVKTRQHLVTTTAERSKNTCHFTLTENEWKCADFLIGYWIDYNDFFIVPTSKLTKTSSGKKTLYKLVFSRLKKKSMDANIYSESCTPFLNDWATILKFVDTDSLKNDSH
ncbi:hypothetical protein CLU83_4242 [Flavobacterium sp. 1]|uniref:protein NO VEIN domain-containing protein n=1 Tax=Flavobacterium sp. 1 TaxID=2035200 RepID=UPI000C23C0EC|nr:DUF3883 domain-containing protein [Flavobacterium sp. 1]PJJ10778.1 hypothetical protein CLU83_4242 [Flavobacterium sp. 1]